MIYLVKFDKCFFLEPFKYALFLKWSFNLNLKYNHNLDVTEVYLVLSYLRDMFADFDMN